LNHKYLLKLINYTYKVHYDSSNNRLCDFYLIFDHSENSLQNLIDEYKEKNLILTK